jgi:hypothetical protein
VLIALVLVAVGVVHFVGYGWLTATTTAGTLISGLGLPEPALSVSALLWLAAGTAFVVSAVASGLRQSWSRMATLVGLELSVVPALAWRAVLLADAVAAIVVLAAAGKNKPRSRPVVGLMLGAVFGALIGVSVGVRTAETSGMLIGSGIGAAVGLLMGAVVSSAMTRDSRRRSR